MRRSFLVAVILLATAVVPSLRADIVEYYLPGTRLVMQLEGQTTFNAGGTVSVRHAKFGTLHFGLRDVTVHKAPPTSTLFQRRLRKASATKDANAVMEAAIWGLKNGLLRQFHEAVDEVLETDPDHAEARRIVELREKIDADLGSSSKEEAELRRLVPKADMRVALSKHFILLHDTPEKPAENRRQTRSEERLALLEQVYESFMYTFYAQGVRLEIPQERLKVVLFNQENDFQAFATALDPQLSSASGFWDTRKNVSVFYDHGSSDQFKVVSQLARQFNELKEQALKNRTPQTKDIVRMANTFSLLVEVEKENSDITVVSHEATHQMAGNTGLLPRNVMVPAWVHEGLATYFEAPSDATWAGIGAVNEERIAWYRALAQDTKHSNVDFIVGDQIFDFAASHSATLHGYAQAWALTHFLMERHFDKLVAYYGLLGEMPPDLRISPQVLNKLFDQAFGGDRKGLDTEWRLYMSSLRTNKELILNDE